MSNNQYAALFALLLGTSAISVPAIAAETAMPQEQSQSLYHRLGGYDAIAAVTDDFIGRLLTDPKFARFFTSLSSDSKLRLRQLVVDQLCAATGGPCIYTGRSMRQSHAGLGITKHEWQLSARHLSASLDKFHVGPREKNEVLAAVTKLEPDIVDHK
jgi:hemoglobin